MRNYGRKEGTQHRTCPCDGVKLCDQVRFDALYKRTRRGLEVSYAQLFGLSISSRQFSAVV